jgi:dTDP-4-amino-4,6-dideoxygalactose transaminase
MGVPFLDLRAGSIELAAELDAAWHRVVRRGWFILGEEVEQFEAAFASYVGVRYCVGVGNGFDALQLSLRAMDIGPGDEVLVPSNTYVATWLAVSAVGATPVPVEPDRRTFNLNPTECDQWISPRTRAIIPVHLYGQPADMEAITSLAKRNDIKVLEDAAQAHGAAIGSRRVGSYGDAAAWSFYPSKNLGALGDAGAITTNDNDLATRVRALRNYGSTARDHTEILGVNSRLDELQAALLSVKLEHLDAWNARRANVAEHYLTEMRDLPVELPVVAAGMTPAWHLFVIQSEQRTALHQRLTELGVQTMVHYPVPPYQQPLYAQRNSAERAPTEENVALTCPVSDGLHRRVLSLPMGPHLSLEQADATIRALHTALEDTMP